MSVPSPCILVCQLDRVTGWCLGCGRTGEEIMHWPQANEDEKQAIAARLPERLAKLGLPPGGDAGEAERRATAQRNRRG